MKNRLLIASFILSFLIIKAQVNQGTQDDIKKVSQEVKILEKNDAVIQTKLKKIEMLIQHQTENQNRVNDSIGNSILSIQEKNDIQEESLSFTKNSVQTLSNTTESISQSLNKNSIYIVILFFIMIGFCIVIFLFYKRKVANQMALIEQKMNEGLSLINNQMMEIKKESEQELAELHNELDRQIAENAGKIEKKIQEARNNASQEMNETKGSLEKMINESEGRIDNQMKECNDKMSDYVNEIFNKLEDKSNEAKQLLNHHVTETKQQVDLLRKQFESDLRKEIRQLQSAVSENISRSGDQLEKEINTLREQVSLLSERSK